MQDIIASFTTLIILTQDIRYAYWLSTVAEMRPRPRPWEATSCIRLSVIFCHC
jgi:hypothetical protein